MLSCTPAIQYDTSPSYVSITDENTVDQNTATFIEPFKDKLDAEMNEVLIISEEALVKGLPESKLGNLIADLSLEAANKLYQPVDGKKVDFCLLNIGGLRTSLPKGDITRGKVFELMPFENELVVVKIDLKSYHELVQYLGDVGGQPIAGDLRVILSKDNKTRAECEQAMMDTTASIKVLTTDYLANGGDKTYFFSDPMSYEPIGIKLRDAIIDYCISQNDKGLTLKGKLDKRISYEE